MRVLKDTNIKALEQTKKITIRLGNENLNFIIMKSIVAPPNWSFKIKRVRLIKTIAI